MAQAFLTQPIATYLINRYQKPVWRRIFGERRPTSSRRSCTLYHGTKDDIAPVEHIDLYAKAIPQALVRRLNGRDHQLNNNLSEVANDIRALSAVGRNH